MYIFGRYIDHNAESHLMFAPLLIVYIIIFMHLLPSHSFFGPCFLLHLMYPGLVKDFHLQQLQFVAQAAL